MSQKAIKLFITNESKQTLGGGWTFIRNFIKALKHHPVYIVDNFTECDIFFIPSVTMADREMVRHASKLGKKIIVRIDNMPRNSRNRNTAYSRMKEMCDVADMVVYQSKWAKEYVSYFTKKNGTIIYNGVDTDIFYPDGDRIEKKANTTYLFVHYNRDENKRYTEAFYEFHRLWREGKAKELIIVGRFSPELVKYNFDFMDAEMVRFLGVIEKPEELAKVYRASDYLFYPSFADACPNTILEAQASGCIPILTNETGGTRELLFKEEGDWALEEYKKKVVTHIDENFTLEKMGAEYFKLFDAVMNLNPDSTIGAEA